MALPEPKLNAEGCLPFVLSFSPAEKALLWVYLPVVNLRGRQKTHDFVFKGLLAKNEKGTINYGGVFKVIDVELAFMYDFFFTKRAVTYYAPWNVYTATLSSFLIYFALTSAAAAVRLRPHAWRYISV
jgi:hypothetical protein